MAYRLKYSDYITTASGPPDPAAWIGPPGPTGPAGATGAQGGEGPPGMGGVVSALDFGIICDGVTDQGVALNAAIASTPPGTTMHIPASVYTTQTIVLSRGRKLSMPVSELMRDPLDSTKLIGSCAIIGSSTLSPVVLLRDNDCGLDGVWVTRNGTPPAGSIGLQCLGQDHISTNVRCYNHARGIQVGALRAAPVGTPPLFSSLCTRFDHCMTWNCTENFIYLINAPETTFYDHRVGINGSTDPAGATACVTIDGDLNSAIDAGSANTISFLRCQFNTGGGVANTIRFYNYGSVDGGIQFTNCYSGGALNAFLFVDPNCNVVRDVKIIGCSVAPLYITETFLSDTGKKLLDLKIIGNRIAGGVAQPAAAFSISGIPAQIIGNSFGGAFTAQLDAMPGGCFIGNTINTLSVTGAFTGPFVVANNGYINITQTATGGINYSETFGDYGSQLTLGQTGQAGRVDFRRGADGAAVAWVGINGAGGGQITEVNNASGSAIVRLNAANTGGADVFMVNSVEMARVDANGLGVSKVTAAAVAPGVLRFFLHTSYLIPHPFPPMPLSHRPALPFVVLRRRREQPGGADRVGAQEGAARLCPHRSQYLAMAAATCWTRGWCARMGSRWTIF